MVSVDRDEEIQRMRFFCLVRVMRNRPRYFAYQLKKALKVCLIHLGKGAFENDGFYSIAFKKRINKVIEYICMQIDDVDFSLH